MKKNEFTKKVRDIEADIELDRIKKLRQMESDMELENRASNLNRARSITVGTSFGGTTEVMMRSDGGRHIWCAMQPVEVVELIHQLAANVGCHVALKPREDFAKWRDWKLTDAEKKHYGQFAPPVNDMITAQEQGANMKKFLDDKRKEQEEFDRLYQRLATGSDSFMVDEYGNLLNEVVEKDGKIEVLGGAGGLSDHRIKQVERMEYGNAVATEKPEDK